MYKWGVTTTAACDCGAEQQTPDHILYHCLIDNLTRKKWAIDIVHDTIIDCSIYAQKSNTADLETTPHTKKKKDKTL